MKVVVITYFQSFTLHPQRSTDHKRVITVELSNGKMLDPVSLNVPAFATTQDVDSFIQNLCDFDGTSVCPFTHACNIFRRLRGLVDSMSSNAQTTSQVSLMAQTREALESGAQFLRTATEAVTAESLISEEALDAGMVTRKEAISKAADKATQAARTTMQRSRTASLDAFKLRVLNHAFKLEWFI
ncbi:hypothetical protein J7T55_011188 [Diaporthe amygdali]|uniref:uncharacterized protein n=1 Tax=Phomopsis amygdali TaxID=1214568 RepID=UPI0022FEAC8F|nr:uncharacterized protein J7T55_011188 [Diaporthe amygdali]KAJ0108699.1 hypothetical protein J7T55_011188 [Diaporthe amygdali]